MKKTTRFLLAILCVPAMLPVQAQPLTNSACEAEAAIVGQVAEKFESGTDYVTVDDFAKASARTERVSAEFQTRISRIVQAIFLDRRPGKSAPAIQAEYLRRCLTKE